MIHPNLREKPGREPLDAPLPAARPPARHILLVLESFELGGAERIALRLANAWVAAGRAVTIFVGLDRGPLSPLVPARAKVARARTPLRLNLLPGLHLALAAAAHIRACPPDLVFLPGNYYADTAIALRLALGRACPPLALKLSNALHRPDMAAPLRWLYGLWLRGQARFVDHFIAMSPALAAEARAIMRPRAGQLSVIDNPAYDGALPPLGVKQDNGPPLILAAGRLVRQKNFSLLVQAFARLRAAQPARLVILGEGEARGELEAEIRRLGVQDCVSLPGFRDDVSAWMRRADLFVLSSLYEGLPAVVVEAMAHGLPVVATDCSTAIGELLSGGLGLVAPVGDAAALAQGMAQMLTAPVNADVLQARARRYSVETAAPAYLQLFDSVAAQADTGARRQQGAFGPAANQA